MENIENLKSIIAENITFYRKNANITQQELANKLNYSDKSISKWERGEGLPDIYILKQIADLFEITVNDLIEKRKEKFKFTKKLKIKNKIIICLLSIGLVWLVATIAHLILKVLHIDKLIITYVYLFAIPISFLLLYIFNRIWYRKNYINCISVSLLFWTGIFSFFYTIKHYLENFQAIFFIGIPFQIIVILWYLMDRKKQNH